MGHGGKDAMESCTTGGTSVTRAKLVLPVMVYSKEDLNEDRSAQPPASVGWSA